jgi:hypothetical protein
MTLHTILWAAPLVDALADGCDSSLCSLGGTPKPLPSDGIPKGAGLTSR